MIMEEDKKNINECDDIILQADKTSNLYKMSPDQYKKLLLETITTEYKKTDENKVSKTNEEAARITDKLDISDRVDAMTRAKAYITVKDHKPRFPDKIDCRLINPSKTYIGKISKSILDRINNDIKQKIPMNQVTNTHQVIDWFDNISDKRSKTFLKFDVVSFYPSITCKLLEDTLRWAKTMVMVTDDEIEIIKNARKAFLFSEEGVWCKKSNPEFDVTMGAFDGAEVCQLIGQYMLFLLSKEIPYEQMILYRDDGLGYIDGSGPTADRIRKKITNIFKSKNLNITTEANLKKTEFLDVFLDLDTGLHRSFFKPNNELRYVSVHSNHPQHIKKQIPKMISERISHLSSNKTIFESDFPKYYDALQDAGYSFSPTYIEKHQPQKKRKKPEKGTLFGTILLGMIRCPQMLGLPFSKS